MLGAVGAGAAGVLGAGCGLTLGVLGAGVLGAGVLGAGAGNVVGGVGLLGLLGTGAVGVVTPGLAFGCWGALVASTLVEMLRIIAPVTATEVRSLICLFIFAFSFIILM